MSWLGRSTFKVGTNDPTLILVDTSSTYMNVTSSGVSVTEEMDIVLLSYHVFLRGF